MSNKPAYFVFSKATVTAGFVADFDRALQSMLDDGTFTAIVNRYVCVDAGAGLSETEDDPEACSLAGLSGVADLAKANEKSRSVAPAFSSSGLGHHSPVSVAPTPPW